MLDKDKSPPESYMVQTLQHAKESIGMNIDVVLADKNDSIGSLESGGIISDLHVIWFSNGNLFHLSLLSIDKIQPCS